MSYQVAHVSSIVIGGVVVTGIENHLVGGTSSVGESGTSGEVEVLESIGMETEDMTPAQRHAYLEERFGPGQADAIERASAAADLADPGSMDVSPLDAKSAPVSCDGFTNESSDSTQISKNFRVGNLSSAVYQRSNAHAIPTSTALGMSRASVICNMHFLCTNTLDPLMEWMTKNTPYTFKIGSGFRNASNGSDHNKGSAVDLHVFKSGKRASREELRLLAIEILTKAKIPFTQFLLEYMGSSSAGWIHIANRNGGGASSLKVGYTLSGNAPYHPNVPKSV